MTSSGKMRGLVPLHDVRRDFGFGKFADAATKLLLFVGKGEIHAVLAVSISEAIVRPRLPYDILHEGRGRLGRRFCEPAPI